MPSDLSPSDWAALRFREPDRRADPTGARLRGAALAAALLVQLAVLHVLLTPPVGPPTSGRALEVVFVESIVPASVPPLPLAPPHRQRPTPASTTTHPGRRAEPAPSPPMAPTVPDPHPTTATPLFSPDGSLRLPVAPQPAGRTPPADARRLGARRDTLPGSDRPIVDIGRMRDRITPQQAVLGLASFLFGGSRPDSCDQVEHRLRSETDPVVRAIDLDKFSRWCRG